MHAVVGSEPDVREQTAADHGRGRFGKISTGRARAALPGRPGQAGRRRSNQARRPNPQPDPPAACLGRAVCRGAGRGLRPVGGTRPRHVREERGLAGRSRHVMRCDQLCASARGPPALCFPRTPARRAARRMMRRCASADRSPRGTAGGRLGLWALSV